MFRIRSASVVSRIHAQRIVNRICPNAAVHSAQSSSLTLCSKRFLASISAASAEVEALEVDDAASSRLPLLSPAKGNDATKATSTQDATMHAGSSEHIAETIASLQSREPNLPNVMFLYDDRGSELFEEITRTPEYYLTNREFEILNKHKDEVARFPDEPKHGGSDGGGYVRKFRSLLVELGAGSGKKMRPLLDATEEIPTTELNVYVPVDCSAGALEENTEKYNNFDERGRNMTVEPLLASNDEALRVASVQPGRKTYLFLGSSLGNFVNPVPFLSNIRRHMGLRDRLLIGVDVAPNGGSKSTDVVNAAYNDSQGVTEKFILNSLSVANRVADLDFDESDWKLQAEYDKETEAVQIYTECVRPCRIHHTDNNGTRTLVNSFDVGDRVFIEQSGKFSKGRMLQVAKEAGLLMSRTWESGDGYFRVQELLPDPFKDVTQMNEFVMQGLVGEENLSTRPIALRNPWAFYWGHVAGFADRVALELPGREQERIDYERGIDPDVDDPSKIHRHSACLDEWPSAAEFQEYDREVEHAMVDKTSKMGVTADTLMAIEHSDMHHETLMYMGNECPHIQFAPHPFASFKPASSVHVADTVDNEAVRIPKRNVRLGADEQLVHEADFVWDNEVPQTPEMTSPAFFSSKFPVINQDFAEFVNDGGYKFKEFWTESEHFSVDSNKELNEEDASRAWCWLQKHNVATPTMWTESRTGQVYSVRTLCDGAIPFEEGSAKWPAMVTLYEAEAYCRWRSDNPRIMTEIEYEAHFADEVDFRSAAYNGNSRWRYRGFVPVGTMQDETELGCHDLVGNGWEWTSTVFDGYPNFEPLSTYSEYSTDFFDRRHFVLKGAGPFSSSNYIRKSFRNFFQPNYRHCMAKFRLCW